MVHRMCEVLIGLLLRQKMGKSERMYKLAENV